MEPLSWTWQLSTNDKKEGQGEAGDDGVRLGPVNNRQAVKLV